MADITGVIVANNVHNGYAVIGENTIDYFQSRPTQSGMIDVKILQKPTIDSITNKWDARWTGVQYY